MLHVNVGYRHRDQRVILHVIDDEVRVLSEDYTLIGKATLNLTRSYQPLRRAQD